MVREYAATKLLSMAKDVSKIELIWDIGDINLSEDNDNNVETYNFKSTNCYHPAISLILVMLKVQSPG